MTFNLCISHSGCAFHTCCTHTPEINDLHTWVCDNYWISTIAMAALSIRITKASIKASFVTKMPIVIKKTVFICLTIVFVRQLIILLKEEIKTRKSISKLFGCHFRSDHAVLRSLNIGDYIWTQRAFIRLQPKRGDLIIIGSCASQTVQ